MTDKSPFVSPLGKRQEVEAAKQVLATANSDQLTLLKAFIGSDQQQLPFHLLVYVHENVLNKVVRLW